MSLDENVSASESENSDPSNSIPTNSIIEVQAADSTDAETSEHYAVDEDITEEQPVHADSVPDASEPEQTVQHSAAPEVVEPLPNAEASVSENISQQAQPEQIAADNTTETVESVPPEIVHQEDAPALTIEQQTLAEPVIAPIDIEPAAGERLGVVNITVQHEKRHEKSKQPKNEHLSDEVFEELKKIEEEGTSFEVDVKSRIRGGLRVVYKNYPLFLPASHFSIKRNPPEKDLQDMVGKKIRVGIHELQEDENGIRTVIVSRKKIVEDEFWDRINTGDIVEGVVSSIATFGVFVDMGGVEGLIHISRLSKTHVDDPKKIAKKGQKIQAVVVELDKDKKRIALSRKELEQSPWQGAEEEFLIGSKHKGIVRRIAEFGAYIEMKPGVDGLLRTSEISWTKRLKTPAEHLKPSDEIDVEILSVSEEKQTIGLSLKRTMPNPWEELAQRYPIDSVCLAKVMQLIPQGAILRINEEIDGFMPRSKIKPYMKGKKIPFHVDDEIEVIISDIIPADESLILAPKLEEQPEPQPQPSRENNRKTNDKNQSPQAAKNSESAFSLLDLITDKEKKSLFNIQE